MPAPLANIFRLVGIGLVLVTLLLLVGGVIASMGAAAGHLDDGIPLDAAMLVLRGQVPNVDFYSVYPPLNAYLISCVFRTLGESIVSYRLLQTLAHVITLGALARLAWRRLSGSTRVVVLCLTALLNVRFYELHPGTALMWSMLALLCLLEGRERTDWGRHVLLALAGVCAAGALWTRPNFGLYLAFVWAVDAVCMMLLRRDRPTLRGISVELLSMGGTAAFTCGLIWTLWGGSLGSLVYQNVVMTSRALAETIISPVPSSLTVSSLFWLSASGVCSGLLPAGWLAIRALRERDGLGRMLATLFVVLALTTLLLGRFHPLLLPVLVAVNILILIAVRLRDPAWLEREEWIALLLSACHAHYVLSRTDNSHFHATFAALALLLVLSAGHGSRTTWTWSGALLFGICGPLVVFNMAHVVKAARTGVDALPALPSLLRSDDDAVYAGCGEECGGYRGDPDELAAASYIRGHTAPSDAVFSGLQRHRRAFTNDMRAYWLMRRPAGTRHIMLMYAITTSAEREQEIIDDLVQRNVKWLFLWDGKPWLRPGVGESAVDTYVTRNFVCAARFGAYEVWRSKVLPGG